MASFPRITFALALALDQLIHYDELEARLVTGNETSRHGNRFIPLRTIVQNQPTAKKS